MAGPRRLTELAESASSRLELPEGPLVVGLSGGADSAALAWLCVRGGRETRSVHVDHGLRHSDRLREAAVAIAGMLGIDLDVVRVDVSSGASPEGQARRARYRAFSEATRPGESLLTAHTLDDDAETILLNLVRGTGTRGLAGIPRWRPVAIVRPALGLRRGEMREMAGLAGLPFVDDPMNDDLALTRNWLRNVIIPRLEAANPRLRESLHRAGELVASESAVIEDMARAVGPELAAGAARVARSQLLTVAEPVASRVLIHMIEHVLGWTAVTGERIARMWSVTRGEASRQEIGGGAVAELVGAMLVLTLHDGDPDRDTEMDERALLPGVNRAGRYEFEVLAVGSVARVVPLSNWSAIFPPGTELVARSDGVVTADGEEAWIVGEKRLPVAWYEPGTVGYLSVIAREGTGWTSSR